MNDWTESHDWRWANPVKSGPSNLNDYTKMLTIETMIYNGVSRRPDYVTWSECDQWWIKRVTWLAEFNQTQEFLDHIIVMFGPKRWRSGLPQSGTSPKFTLTITWQMDLNVDNREKWINVLTVEAFKSLFSYRKSCQSFAFMFPRAYIYHLHLSIYVDCPTNSQGFTSRG